MYIQNVLVTIMYNIDLCKNEQKKRAYVKIDILYKQGI